MTKKNYQAVIAIGGKGSRLREISNDIPKPLYPIFGKPTLLRCFEQLFENGIDDVILTVGYKTKIFNEYISFLKKTFPININIFYEESPLGECGALWEINNQLKQDFIFINGDIIFSVDINRIFYFHNRINSKLTLVTHTCEHPEDSDLLTAPNGSLIQEIFLKSVNNHHQRNAYLSNSGIALINKDILKIVKAPSVKSKSKSESSIFNYLAKNTFEKLINIYSYNSTEYIKDMGTPERFKKIQNDLEKKNIEQSNYINKQKVLFVDRDNTIIFCENKKYILQGSDLKFMEKNISNLALLSKNYNFVCMVTNQPQISMGLLKIEELDSINSKIIKFCLTKGLKIDVVSFCPHHPHNGFIGEIKYLKNDCFCRKPNPGQFFEQAFMRNIDLRNSLMVGDSENDKIAATNAGCDFKYINEL